jgi:hypothetical protein
VRFADLITLPGYGYYEFSRYTPLINNGGVEITPSKRELDKRISQSYTRKLDGAGFVDNIADRDLTRQFHPSYIDSH